MSRSGRRTSARFTGELKRCAVNGVGWSTIRATAHGVRRSGEQATGPADPFYKVSVQLSGRGLLIQDGREPVLETRTSRSTTRDGPYTLTCLASWLPTRTRTPSSSGSSRSTCTTPWCCATDPWWLWAGWSTFVRRMRWTRPRCSTASGYPHGAVGIRGPGTTTRSSTSRCPRTSRTRTTPFTRRGCAGIRPCTTWP
ncbi:hypothetical protein GFY24_13515 [Nocardia sp. SYP-A9097]|nr:hypothetical protein [Nocardia sp. SYP-A9097]